MSPSAPRVLQTLTVTHLGNECAQTDRSALSSGLSLAAHWAVLLREFSRAVGHLDLSRSTSRATMASEDSFRWLTCSRAGTTMFEPKSRLR